MLKFLTPLALIASLILPLPALAAEPVRDAVIYKDPDCGCCAAYADYLRRNGYAVAVRPTRDLAAIKRRHRVPPALESCHTMLIGGYVVEGHVPLEVIERLLKERPAIRGISLPGMPAGSPGMGGRKTAPFAIFEIGDGAPRVYAVE